MNQNYDICYSTDASRLIGKASKVVFPKKAEEVAYLIRTNPDIVIRGAGTGLVGGAIPYNSVVIDMNKLDKVLIFNPKNRERGSWKMFFVGLLYASLSLLLVHWFFSSDPTLAGASGMIVITFPTNLEASVL